MIRILHVYPQLNNAGTEKVILNLYENINREEIQFDFLVEKKGELDEYITSLGGNIYYLPVKNKNSYYKELIEFFKNHNEFKIMHTHTHALMSTVLKAAKKCNIPCRIAHSHNARNDLSKIAWFVKGMTSIPMELYATHFFACSFNAAKWLFPHKVKQCKVLYNGISLNKFLFNIEQRNYFRNKFNIKDNELVFIHVGRFAKQKNHKALISIFEEYDKKVSKEWKAILIGCGPLEKEIKDLAKEKSIYEKILFLGNRNDVNQLLSAGDCFVFPSLHEGLGIVVIEAQANALPCIVSDAVPVEADLKLGLLTRLTLSNSYDGWINEIKKINIDTERRTQYEENIIDCEYNIKKVANYLTDFYKEMYTNE